MKTFKTTHYLVLALLCLCFFSCKPKDRGELILGTWSVTKVGTIGEPDKTSIEITFNKDSSAVSAMMKDGKVLEKSSMTYSISGDGKYLTTKESQGPETKLNILELTDKILKLNPVSDTDTTALTFTRK